MREKQNSHLSHVGRRDFIKNTAIASMIAGLPATGLAGREAAASKNSSDEGKRKRLLYVSESKTTHPQLLALLKAIPETDLAISEITVDYKKPQEMIQAIYANEKDILLLCLPSMTFSFGSLYDSMGDLNIPIIVLSSNPELILIDANFIASLRGNGANVTFALSDAQALELVKVVMSPRILEGKRAVLFGRPFDSTTVPARNLTEDYVYQRTGVRIQYRPMEELTELFKAADEGGARSEMERWKKEAAAVIRVSDKSILDACRLYMLLRSLVEKEKLSAVGIDCLGFTMNPNPPIPYPCLAFARLRDEGITAACESDLCGLLSSMFLQEISHKPSFMCNVMSVEVKTSRVVLSHCVAPLKLNGPGAPAMKYKLHDYHNFGKGVVPEVEFPIGAEITTGEFSKNLKSFSLWPGRIESQVKDTDHAAAPKGGMLNACANTMTVRIRDAGHFLQNIAGIHHTLVTGNYAKAIEDALFRMNVNLVGPSDLAAPGI